MINVHDSAEKTTAMKAENGVWHGDQSSDKSIITSRSLEQGFPFFRLVDSSGRPVESPVAGRKTGHIKHWDRRPPPVTAPIQRCFPILLAPSSVVPLGGIPPGRGSAGADWIG